MWVLLALLATPYAEQVQTAVSEQLPAPLAAGQAATGPVTLHVDVDPKGAVTQVAVAETSGSDAFDAAAIRAVKTAKLPAPAAKVTRVVVKLRERAATPVRATKTVPIPDALKKGAK